MSRLFHLDMYKVAKTMPLTLAGRFGKYYRERGCNCRVRTERVIYHGFLPEKRSMRQLP